MCVYHCERKKLCTKSYEIRQLNATSGGCRPWQSFSPQVHAWIEDVLGWSLIRLSIPNIKTAVEGNREERERGGGGGIKEYCRRHCDVLFSSSVYWPPCSLCTSPGIALLLFAFLQGALNLFQASLPVNAKLSYPCQSVPGFPIPASQCQAVPPLTLNARLSHLLPLHQCIFPCNMGKALLGFSVDCLLTPCK